MRSLLQSASPWLSSTLVRLAVRRGFAVALVVLFSPVALGRALGFRVRRLLALAFADQDLHVVATQPDSVRRDAVAEAEGDFGAFRAVAGANARDAVIAFGDATALLHHFVVGHQH